MAEIRLSRVALVDFDEILDYLQSVAGNAVAADYADQLHASVNRLVAFPVLVRLVHISAQKPA